MDQERERRYGKFAEFATKEVESGTTPFGLLTDLIEPVTRGTLQENLSPEVGSAITLETPYFPSLSEIAGMTASRRPIFVVRDPYVWEKVSKIIEDPKHPSGITQATGWMVPIDEGPWKNLGLLITSGDERAKEHEARHSLDNVNRVGSDHLIGEMFAFYGEYILDPYRPDWEGYIGILDQFYDECRVKPQREDPKREKKYRRYWESRLHGAVNRLKSFREQHGDLVAQRTLVQHRFLHEFIEGNEPSIRR